MECFELNISETLRCIRLLLERVRSPEGSAGKSKVVGDSSRNLQCDIYTLTFLFLSLFLSSLCASLFSFPHYSTLQPPVDSESGEERRGGIDAKDGFRYRKDRQQDFPSYIPAASYSKIRTYSLTDRFERVSVKVTSPRVYFLINLHGSRTSLAYISR